MSKSHHITLLVHRVGATPLCVRLEPLTCLLLQESYCNQVQAPISA